MKISARNVFRGTVTRLTPGPVSAEVEVTTGGGDRLIGTITQSSAQSLGLAVGKPVVAVIKASSVMVMSGAENVALSARNCLRGTVTRVTAGPVSAEVLIDLPGGAQVCASITSTAADDLDLQPGAAAVAVIKASAVIVGVEG